MATKKSGPGKARVAPSKTAVKPLPDTELELHRRFSRKPGQKVHSIAIQRAGQQPELRAVIAGARVARFPQPNPFHYALMQGGVPASKFTTAYPLFEMWAPEYWDNYASMNRYWAEFRRNWLVRACINQLAYWSTKNGFDTTLQAADPDQFENEDQEAKYLKQFGGLKSYIDRSNKRVDLDFILKQVIIQAKVIGRMGYEIETNNNDEVTALVPLRPDQILPIVSPDWKLAGFSYRWQGFSLINPFFKPEDVLYFANNDVDGSFKGISDIEPILKEVQLDDKVIREDLTEAATTLWAGQIIWMLDVDKLKPGTTEAEIQSIIDAHIAALLPGKSIATDNRWTAQVVDLKPDLTKLLDISERMKTSVLGNFQVPRFIVAMEQTLNRATAYAELETFVQGPISDVQRWLAREVERQWYDRLTRSWLVKNKKLKADAPLPVIVKHRWHEVRTTDWFELIKAVALAFAAGQGFVDKVKAWEMIRDGVETSFDPEQLKALQEQLGIGPVTPATAPKTIPTSPVIPEGPKPSPGQAPAKQQ